MESSFTSTKTSPKCHYDGCNMTSSRAKDVERHINTVHLKTRRRQCPTCEKKFNREDGLKNHLSTIHGLDLKMPDMPDNEYHYNSTNCSYPREQDTQSAAVTATPLFHDTSTRRSTTPYTEEPFLRPLSTRYPEVQQHQVLYSQAIRGQRMVSPSLETPTQRVGGDTQLFSYPIDGNGKTKNNSVAASTDNEVGSKSFTALLKDADGDAQTMWGDLEFYPNPETPYDG